MNALFKSYLVGALACWVMEAAASPVVSIDMDPSEAGIQNALIIAQGMTFQIEVILDTDGLDVAGFEFDIAPGGISGFPAMASGIDVLPVFGAGDTFGFPNTVVDEQTLDNSSGEAAAAASQGVFGAAVNGAFMRLATLEYAAIALGSLALDLNDLRLADTVGGFLMASVSDGQLEVTAAVPTPSAALLLIVGWLALLVRKSKRAQCLGKRNLLERALSPESTRGD